MILTYMCLLNIIHNQTMLQNFIKYLNLKKTVESSNRVYSFLHVYDVHCIVISHQPRRDFWITSSTKLFKYSPVSLNISNLKYKCIHRSKITLNLLKLLFKRLNVAFKLYFQFKLVCPFPSMHVWVVLSVFLIAAGL